jgi:L-aspartate oxidase
VIARVAAPVVVVGGGIAGMTAALALRPYPVVLVLRGALGHDGATVLAQGGIAAALDGADHPVLHALDTMVAGGGTNRRDAVALLTRGAAGAVRWLQGEGVAFDRDGAGLALAREGGHRCARVVHAGGDATGASIAAILARRVREAGHVEVLEHRDVDALLLAAPRVAGVRLRGAKGHELRRASAVVLATGGIGGLFAWRTGPDACDGAGLALPLAAGARLQDLEFIQFHPTALAPAPGASGRLDLVTEALRGAGARLRGDDGRALMQGRHPAGDLAPRDVVARVVAASGGAWLDATGLAIDWHAAFPTVLRLLAARGLDPRRDRIPVVPAVHFHMGGIATDLHGRTRVPGLFAVGEVACTGVHGGNRLASNSLLEGVVFGQRVARAAALEPSVCDALVVAESGGELAPAELQALRLRLADALGPVRRFEVLARALAATTGDSRQERVARAVLQAALANRERIGAHWPDVPADCAA